MFYVFVASLLDPIVMVPIAILGAFVRPRYSLAIAFAVGLLIAVAMGPSRFVGSEGTFVLAKVSATVIAALIGTLFYRRRMRRRAA